MATVIESIGTGGGRDYSTVNAWEAATDGFNLPAIETAYVGEVYDDGDITESGLLTFAGTTAADAFYNRTVRAADGHAYDSSTGAGVIIRVTAATNLLAIRESYLTIQGLGLRNDGSWISGTHYTVSFDTTPCDQSQLVGCTLLNPTTGSSSNTIHVYLQGATATGQQFVRSCVFIGSGVGTGVAYGVYALMCTGGPKIQNCTAFEIDGPTNGHGFFVNSTCDGVTVENCIAIDSGVADFQDDGANSVFRNNLASDTTATGTGSDSHDSQTKAGTFTDADAGDFSLVGTSNAVDGGADLSGEFFASYQPGVRHGSGTGTAWEIGALAYVAATIAAVTSSITLRSQSTGICPDAEEAIESRWDGVRSTPIMGSVLARGVFEQQVRRLRLNWRNADERERYLLLSRWVDARGTVKRMNYTPVGDVDSNAILVRFTEAFSITQTGPNAYEMSAELEEAI